MNTHNHKQHRKKVGTDDRTPVEQFAIDYECPQALANLLVGATEEETEANIALMKEYIVHVIEFTKEKCRKGRRARV